MDTTVKEVVEMFNLKDLKDGDVIIYRYEGIDYHIVETVRRVLERMAGDLGITLPKFMILGLEPGEDFKLASPEEKQQLLEALQK